MSASYKEDVELAGRCAAGDEAAWQRFILEYRPVLYRAADALDSSGNAREIADALYGELYGLKEADGTRRSLFRYYQGRSSLATWLRAVLSQRYVDHLRARKRLVPLPEDRETTEAVGATGRRSGAVEPPSPDRPRHLELVRSALVATIAGLADRDRLRLAWYYVESLTLAQIGKALAEHEATVSRQLARTRRALRQEVERRLREQGLRDEEIAECFESAAEDPGPLDLKQMLGAAGGLSTLNNDQIAERGARMARPDDRACREHVTEEQRSQPGCPAREVVHDQHGQATNDRKKSMPDRSPI